MEKRVKIVIIGLILVISISQFASASENSDKKKSVFLQISLTANHWQTGSNVNNSPQLRGVEYYPGEDYFYGTAHFKNSYYQPCWYFYGGNIFTFSEKSEVKLYGKVTYGIITGYDDEDGRYRAIFNRLGTFPAIVPGIGVSYKNVAVETIFFADAGYMVNAGVRFYY
jgi:hypothetical protein